MNVLDASALIAFLRGEPAAPEVEAMLRSERVAISAVNLAEVVDHLGRRGRLPSARIDAVLGGLVADAITVLPCDEAQGRRAGALRAAHYDRRAAPLSLADCFGLATAEAAGALVSSDRALLRVARREGVAVHRVRDSSGRRPR